MQHKSDILEALAAPRSRYVDLEDAFRALVDWPKVDMVAGLSGTLDALDLLGTVAAALVDIGDTRIMPGETLEILEDMAAARDESIVENTYMAGALFVRDRLHLWRPVLRDAKTDGAS